jgi:putative transposase
VNAVRCDVLEAGMEIPITRLCRILGVPRSTAYHQPKVERMHRPVDEALARTIHEIIQAHPTYGIRRVWAWLRYRLDQSANRKKIHRLMRIKGWTMRQRAIGKRPRVPGSKSIAPEPNQRWCTDIALIECGQDGWCAFVPVLGCCTREVLGWCLDRTARAQTAERALEEALIHRFGWTHGAPKGLTHWPWT